jgi:hypothetical protein
VRCKQLKKYLFANNLVDIGQILHVNQKKKNLLLHYLKIAIYKWGKYSRWLLQNFFNLRHLLFIATTVPPKTREKKKENNKNKNFGKA